MSLWDSEVFRVDGQLIAYCRIQNDWTGNTAGSFRKVKQKDGHYYVKADGKSTNMDNEVNRFLKNEQEIKDAITFFRKYNGRVF